MSSPSSRRSLMKQDVAAVINTCRAFQNCPFKDFSFDENMLAFMYVDPTGKLPPRQANFNFSEDYPEQTVVSWTNELNDPTVAGVRVQHLFNQISHDLNEDVHVPTAGVLLEGDQADDTHPELARTISSNSSYYSDCNSDVASDELDMEEDYYKDNLLESDDENMMHPLLQQEIELVRVQYGEKSISHRLFGAIDDIDVELHIGMSFLDAEIAKAWKVIQEEPVVVRIHLSLSRYLDANEPKVEVFQPSQKEKFGIGSQLRKILEQFISDSWKKITNEFVEAKLAKSARRRKVAASLTKKRLQFAVASIFGSVTKKLRCLVTSNSDQALQADVGSAADEAVAADTLNVIREMGFTEDMGRRALVLTHGNLEQALNLLLTSPDSLVCGSLLEDGHYRANIDHMFSPGAVQAPPAARDKRGTKPGKERLWPRAVGGGTRAAPGGRAAGDTGTDAACCSFAMEDLHLLPSSTQSGKNAKQVPDVDSGFLAQVLQYTRQRLPTLNEYCVVCDEPHVFQNGAMLKPAVCARELCVFGFQTLGVMSDAAEDIATGAEVVNLLIAMAVAACRSSRRDVIFEPYPTVVDPNQTELALNPKKKDYKRCEKAMDGFMEMNEMMSLVGSDLKKKMDTLDSLSYPLLQWIITSNRSHIVKLPPEKQISFMHTPHQFLLMSSPPAKEAVFRSRRQQYGSTFAFHGSHIENWHSIMRLGLINASGTKHQMHGAAYGKGIYLSPHASVSSGYSGMGHSHHNAQKGSKMDGKDTSRFLNSKNLTCIALCEVINHDLQKHNNNIWVQPNADYCCTRFFFVYEDGQVGDSSIDTQVDKYHKEVMRAVSYVTR